MLSGDLNGKEVKKGDVCLCMADSLCCTVGTDTAVVKQLCSNKKALCFY